MNKIDEVNSFIMNEIRGKGISTKKISDGHHTFGELYEHRYLLFSLLCNAYPEISFKTKKHYDEENDPMYPNSFLAGILFKENQFITYHIPLKYWDLFQVPEFDRGPKYDKMNSDVLHQLKEFSKLGKIYCK